MASFATEALRGFGGNRITFAAVADGGHLSDTQLGIAASQRRDLYRYGFRPVITEEMRKAVSK